MSLDVLLEPLPDRSSEVRLCKLGSVIAGLEEPYQSALVGLLTKPFRDGGASDELIAERLKQAKLPVGATVINRHRRDLCVCKRVQQ